jgi:hypothetical protein
MTQEEPFPNLSGHSYMNLTTFRKSGVAVPTPVWFAVDDGKLHVVTDGNSGKVKRIRNNPRVLVEPCTSQGKTLGPSAQGTARIFSRQDGARSRLALDRKYKIAMALFTIFWHMTGQAKTVVFLEIEPAQDRA